MPLRRDIVVLQDTRGVEVVHKLSFASVLASIEVLDNGLDFIHKGGSLAVGVAVCGEATP